VDGAAEFVVAPTGKLFALQDAAAARRRAPLPPSRWGYDYSTIGVVRAPITPVLAEQWATQWPRAVVLVALCTRVS